MLQETHPHNKTICGTAIGEIVKNSYKTAISRTRPSAPMTYLNSKNLLQGRVIDVGCGKGKDCKHFDIDGYDIHYRPEFPLSSSYDTVTCNYVLNVLPEEVETSVICECLAYLKKGGIAYFTVRRDKFKCGYNSSRKTFQRIVELDAEILIEKKGAFCIYKLVRL